MQRYEKYKDIDIEWIGDIPKSWRIIKYKFISKIKKGKMPNKITSMNLGNLPPYMSMEYLRGGDENQWVLDKSADIVNEEEILLLWDGSNAGEFIKSRKGVISSTVALVQYKNINKNFAWYLSKIVEDKLRQNTNGMGIPHVDGTFLKNLKLTLPAISEQQTIATFLDGKTFKIDQTVAIKQKEIELLKERRQILVQKAVTKGLDDTVKMKDSGVEWIGEIPEHWEVAKNKTIFKESKRPGEENLPLLSVSIHTGVSDNELSDEDNIRGKIKIEDKSNYKLVSKNDIVYNMMRAWQGAIGSVTVKKGLVSPAYVVATPSTKVFSKFFEYQYRTSLLIEQMNQHSKGITDFRKRLYWEEFKQIFTILPPFEEQVFIVNYIDEIEIKVSKAISIKQQEIERLKEYKTVLIDNVVTGRVRVN